MKKDIHPNYEIINTQCSCGNFIQIRSTLGHDLHLDICNNCHPFYTGQQRDFKSSGRIASFNKRFSMLEI